MKGRLSALIMASLVIALPVFGQAVVDRGTDVFELELPSVNFPCWGEEPIYVYIYAPFSWQTVQTPAGGSVYVEKWDTKNATGVVVGLETGREWLRVVHQAKVIDRSAGGDAFTAVYNGVFIPVDEGPVIRVHELMRMRFDANGILRVDEYVLNCSDKE